MRARTFFAVVFLLVTLPLGGAARAADPNAVESSPWYVTIDGAFDYETVQIAASWWPDPNGGLGVLFVTDSAISEDTGDNFALGACATFRLDEAYKSLVGTILPALELPSVPLTTYGRLGVTWDVNDDGDMTFVAATGAMLFPDRIVQPTIWAEYLRPEGSANEEPEARAMFGVTIWLGWQ